VQPAFSPDGARVLFLDKPAPDAPVGLYGVPVDRPLSAPALFTELLGPFSPDMTLAVDLVAGRTVVQRLADGQRWTIANGGRRVSVSPDNARIAWVVAEQAGNFDVRRSDVWVADVDGKNARRIATRYGGGIQAWLPDSSTLLVSGKASRGQVTSTLSLLSIGDGALRDVAEVDRLRSPALSPDGRRLAYYAAQSRDDPARNGTWLARLDAPGPPQRLPFFGAYRWCDATRLLVVPLTLDAPSSELWVHDTTAGQSRRLIAAAAGSPFKIANGDWDVSPDGARVVYLNARDRNLWLADLGAPCGR
jgi:Tol biopolymer transport system component